MSDTTTPETDYPSLSEATENDVRESSEDIAQTPEPQPQADGDGQKPPEAPPTEDTPEPEPDDLQARNARLARELREQKRLARQMADHAAALQGQKQETPDESMQREINIRAAQLAAQQQVNAKSNQIYQQGCAAYGKGEFDSCVQQMNESFGQGVMPVVLDTLTDLPDAEKLVQYLGANPDIADDLAQLPPHKLGAALQREAHKLSTPKSKPISRAPAPIKPIAQAAVPDEDDLEHMSMEQLAKRWDKRDFLKRFE